MGMDPTRAGRGKGGDILKGKVAHFRTGLLGAGIALLSGKLSWGCFGWRGNPPAFQQMSGRSLWAVRDGGYFGWGESPPVLLGLSGL